MKTIRKNTKLSAIRNLGISSNTKNSEKIKVQIVNNLCIMALLCWATGNFVIRNPNQNQYLIASFPLLLSFILPLILNKLGKFKEARFVFIATVSISLFLLYISFGSSRYYEIVYLLLFIIVFYLTDSLKERIVSGLFLLVSWLIPLMYVKQHPENYETIDSHLIVLLLFSCVLVCIYLIVQKTQDQINEISKKQDENLIRQKKNLELISYHNQLLSVKGKELSEKNNEIETFFSLSSEYLKNPTRELIRISESLQKNNSEDGIPIAADIFKIIHDSSLRMNDLIEAVFEYSAISKDSVKETLDSEVVLNEIIDDLHASIEDKSAKISFKNMPTIDANLVELRMLFQNLISNAIKYCKKGVDPVVKIDCIDAGDMWKFSIKDNGIGIEKEHQSNIFNMFKKLHNQEEYAGSGIGLSHCKKIVNLHGGEIWVESEIGLGTTVFFTLQKKHS